MSYSRSEAPFVDALASALERIGFTVWLDYRNMIPGVDWDDQLAEAIREADAVLLVASRRSIEDSKPVTNELERARACHRPVVVALVEAVPLPEELRRCSWADMRGDFTSAVRRLGDALLGESDVTRSSTRPEAGFKAPVPVWLTAALAVPVGLLSLAALWTVVIPFVLVPLPIRLLRREFDYTAVRTSLMAMPLAALVPALIAEDSWGEESVAVAMTESITGYSVILALGLYLAIRSRPVRRWMKPIAARPAAARRNNIEREPNRSTFAIDSAPEDIGYAIPLEQALLAQQHEPKDPQDADITLRLVSRFNDTEEIPADQLVLPVLIQDPDDELPERLKRTQWIDLRRGARSHELEGIARLLDDPADLLRTIGIPPPHDQLVMPPGVLALYLGLWAAVLAPLSALWFAAYAQVRYDLDLDLAGPLAFFILAAIVVSLSWWAKNAVVERRPGVPLRRLVAVIVFGLLGLLIVTWQADSDHPAETFAAAARFAVLAPTMFVPLIWAIYGKSIERWIPARPQSFSAELSNRRSHAVRLLAIGFVLTIFSVQTWVV